MNYNLFMDGQLVKDECRGGYLGYRSLDKAQGVAQSLANTNRVPVSVVTHDNTVVVTAQPQ